MMELTVIGARTMKMVLGTVLVLQLFVLSSALKIGDPGVCSNDVAVEGWRYMRHPTKYLKCPKQFLPCSKKESSDQRYGRGFKCCKTKTTKLEKKSSCCDGWEFQMTDRSCKPICRFGCTNGRCTAPDVCECDTPLLLVNNNQCVQPVCETPCFNGQCIANNTCKCNDGFKPYNETHCATECTSGYLNDPITLNCIPKCDQPCVNGTCDAPNTCKCKDGHKSKDNYTCVPECTTPCVNAACVAPNTCSCFDGYSLRDGQCVPVCDQPCKNGTCSAPNVCQCNAGYELDDENKFNCLPECEPKCVNASCVSPNTCLCHSGYETTGSSWICQPKCEDCENGMCVAPDRCHCNEGYVKINGTCEPVCDRPCSDGICSEPNVCTCNAGYQLNSTDKFSCEPVCEENCVNATCTSPNTCSCRPGYEPTGDNHICKPKCTTCHHGECVHPDVCECHEGYNMTNGQCSPVCTVPCINGKCTAPNICTCTSGYKKKSLSVCYKPCKSLCNHGVCSLHGVCRCDRGYEMINDTCTPITPMDCKTCDYNCSAGDCWCVDDQPCVKMAAESELAGSTSTTMAGLELTWTLGGALVLLLMILVTVVMHRIYRKRKHIGNKDVDDLNMDRSVLYTVPQTLVQRGDREDVEGGDNDDYITKTDRLLNSQSDIQDQKL